KADLITIGRIQRFELISPARCTQSGIYADLHHLETTGAFVAWTRLTDDQVANLHIFASPDDDLAGRPIRWEAIVDLWLDDASTARPMWYFLRNRIGKLVASESRLPESSSGLEYTCYRLGSVVFLQRVTVAKTTFNHLCHALELM